MSSVVGLVVVVVGGLFDDALGLCLVLVCDVEFDGSFGYRCGFLYK